ncbi:HBR039Wp [Eremothecium sinecaudum]|uniref:HBR039Wp n=1 Tax=Eremothecium sinecaudum TaxID=45286 RepID=A0A125RDY8_9SACH|nr:HBR039Wp [Eremothecium sinecaudum]AMD18940.1 HBR039Wp [Eremothecium sinecaudum]
MSGSIKNEEHLESVLSQLHGQDNHLEDDLDTSNSAQTPSLDFTRSTDSEFDSYTDGYDEDEEEYDSLSYTEELLNAQYQWEQSLEQLKQVVNWLLLPLMGRFLGRRMAGVLWRSFMSWWWSI